MWVKLKVGAEDREWWGLVRAQCPLDSIPIQIFLKHSVGLTMHICMLLRFKTPGPGQSPGSEGPSQLFPSFPSPFPPWSPGTYALAPLTLVPGPSTTCIRGLCPLLERPFLPSLTSFKSQLKCGPPLRWVVGTSKADGVRTAASLQGATSSLQGATSSLQGATSLWIPQERRPLAPPSRLGAGTQRFKLLGSRTPPRSATRWRPSGLLGPPLSQAGGDWGAGLCTHFWHFQIASFSCSTWPLDLMSPVEAGLRWLCTPFCPQS